MSALQRTSEPRRTRSPSLFRHETWLASPTAGDSKRAPDSQDRAMVVERKTLAAFCCGTHHHLLYIVVLGSVCRVCACYLCIAAFRLA